MASSSPAIRIAGFGESMIREMTRLSDLYGAINLSQGMPDFDPPPQLVNAAIEALKQGSNQYAITWGQPRLREVISAKVKEYNGIDADPEKDITVTCGSAEAVTAALLGLTDIGQRVVVTDPFYENYVPGVLLAGGSPIYVPFTGEDLSLDEEPLKDAMEAHPKLIVINNPNNPTGRVLTREELKLIADLCEDSGIIAVTDEIYEHIVYDGRKHISLATIGNMHERTVTVSGLSKTYSVTGWRVGWAIAEDNLALSVRKVHDYLTICAPTPFQEAAVTALRMPRGYYEELSRSYERKREMILACLEEAGIGYYRPEGAYYVLADAPGNFKSGEEFAHNLLMQCGLAVLPAAALYHDKARGLGKIRLTFCKRDETLAEVRKRFKRLAEPRDLQSAVSHPRV